MLIKQLLKNGSYGKTYILVVELTTFVYGTLPEPRGSKCITNYKLSERTRDKVCCCLFSVVWNPDDNYSPRLYSTTDGGVVPYLRVRTQDRAVEC